ncbi:MAG TPA: PAS domain-containing protein, partial [Ilumatobacter sp.]
MLEDAAGLQDPLRSALAALANPNAVLDALGHAVIVTGVDGRIVQWNRAAAELYGVKRDDALGQDVVEVVVPEEGRAAARAILDRVAAGE